MEGKKAIAMEKRIGRREKRGRKVCQGRALEAWKRVNRGVTVGKEISPHHAAITWGKDLCVVVAQIVPICSANPLTGHRKN